MWWQNPSRRYTTIGQPLVDSLWYTSPYISGFSRRDSHLAETMTADLEFGEPRSADACLAMCDNSVPVSDGGTTSPPCVTSGA